MTQASDRQQAKRDFLNAAKVIFADEKFTDWMPILIFLGIPIAFGINLYVFIDAFIRNTILTILVSILAQLMRVNDLSSWVIGYIKIGTVFIDILAFTATSFLLFVMSKNIRKMI